MNRDWLSELFRDRGSDEDIGLRGVDELGDPRVVDPPLPDEPLVAMAQVFDDLAAS